MKYAIDGRVSQTAPRFGHLNLGGQSPSGDRLQVNSRYLLFNQRPWLPVMGEFHFSRYDADEWETELRKIKSCGVSIVASYLFWNHHEAREGEFNFEGRRNLRRFVELCAKVGLWSVIRLGPWAHGESRYGGFPDWLMEKNIPLRGEDPEYMGYVDRLYAAYARELKGLFFKDGGPIIALQVENELTGDSDYLLKLKKMALDHGMEAPFYTVTGWGADGIAQFPENEVLPLFGGYPEAPWEQHTHPLPPNPHFFFTPVRNDSSIGSDQIAGGSAPGNDELEAYPFLTCELGPGNQVTYHRRPIIQPMDAYAMSLCLLGSGSNLPGYYMFHGGYNPTNGLFQESRDTGYPNDVPVSSYDFQAPVGEYGDLKPSYFSLKRLHHLLMSYGENLAAMEPVFPDEKPKDLQDTVTPRYVIRSNGKSGFVFFNSYQRLAQLSDQPEFQLEIALEEETVCVPPRPVNLPAGVSLIFPFNLTEGELCIKSASVQPLYRMKQAEGITLFMFAPDGVEPLLLMNRDPGRLPEGVQSDQGLIDGLAPGTDCCLEFNTEQGLVRIVILTEDQSKAFFVNEEQKQTTICIAAHGAIVTPAGFKMLGTPDAEWLLYPPLTPCAGGTYSGRSGIFSIYREELANPPMTVGISPALALIEADNPYAKYLFAPIQDCPEYLLQVPSDLFDHFEDMRLDFETNANVIQVYCGDELVADSFQYERRFTMGLKRFRSAIESATPLRFKCSPFTPEQDIYMEAPRENGRPWIRLLRSTPLTVINVPLN